MLRHDGWRLAFFSRQVLVGNLSDRINRLYSMAYLSWNIIVLLNLSLLILLIGCIINEVLLNFDIIHDFRELIYFNFFN